jgi:hypothetical protein
MVYSTKYQFLIYLSSFSQNECSEKGQPYLYVMYSHQEIWSKNQLLLDIWCFQMFAAGKSQRLILVV